MFFFFRFVLVWVWCRSASLLLEVLDSVVLVCFHHLNRRMSLVVHTDLVQFTGPFYVFSPFWLQNRIFTPVPVIFPALRFAVLALWKMRGSVFGLIIEFQITSKKILTLGHGCDSWIWAGNVILRFLLCADSKPLVCFSFDFFYWSYSFFRWLRLLPPVWMNSWPAAAATAALLHWGTCLKELWWTLTHLFLQDGEHRDMRSTMLMQ